MNNLKAELARRNIALCEVAQTLGISVKTLYNKLYGRSTFGIDEAFKIRDTYFSGMGLDYLFGKGEE
ncbi:MAG: XRE family transcriptional regulator [Oscillospiraceae bacterium]|nr:XRE family transcriptional regulator [Oscillospiraceae bacterium]